VQLVVEENGMPIAVSTPNNLTDLYLKLGKTGTNFTAYYSADGPSWTRVGEVQQPLLDYVQFAFSAWNGSPSDAAEIPADFDWFCVLE